MTLDATLAGGSSDSYVASAAEAITIAGNLALLTGLGVSTAGFLALATAGQEFALRMAADRVDRAVAVGVRFSDLQARAWPRVRTGQLRYEQVIPDQVKYAQVADACFLATAASQNASMAQQGVESFTVSEESVTFRESAKAESERPVSAAADQILRQAGLVKSRVASVYVPRV